MTLQSSTYYQWEESFEQLMEWLNVTDEKYGALKKTIWLHFTYDCSSWDINTASCLLKEMHKVKTKEYYKKTEHRTWY